MTNTESNMKHFEMDTNPQMTINETVHTAVSMFGEETLMFIKHPGRWWVIFICLLTALCALAITTSYCKYTS